MSSFFLAALALACSDEQSPGASDGAGSPTGSTSNTAAVTGTPTVTTGGSASTGMGATNTALGANSANTATTGSGGASNSGTTDAGTAASTSSVGGMTASSSTGGMGGSGGGTGSSICPAGSEAMAPTLTGSPTEITAVPPDDGYNPFNIEGPVWIDGALYLTEMANGQNPPPARILKYTPGGSVEIWKDDVGTNGLAVDANGVLYGASHKDGSISRYDLSNPSADPVPLVNMYMGTRFSSPNDLAIRSDGIIYFTDPQYQSDPENRQPEERAYWFDSADTSPINVIAGLSGTPNGITLSPDEQTLYIGSTGQIMAFPVNADGSVGTGMPFGGSEFQGVDGMGVDCAGNLYAAVHNGGYVVVLSPSGSELGRIQIGQGVTNVAFGGTDRTTLYITRLTETQLWEINVGIPGYPY